MGDSLCYLYQLVCKAEPSSNKLKEIILYNKHGKYVNV